MVDTLDAARDAFGRHAWSEARDAFVDASAAVELDPDDLRMLADASWWAGHPDEAVDALERAYEGYAGAGDRRRAAFVAVQLAYLAFRRQAFAVGSGWVGRAEEQLSVEPDAPEHAWLRMVQAAGLAFGEREAARAVGVLDDALAMALDRGVPEVQALATSIKGTIMIGAGEWRQGMALVDQAAAMAVSGRLDLRPACDIYCNTIAACRNVSDYGRAGEWTEEAERWMHRNALGGYPGICRVHRAELKKLHGSYSDAEQEARVACEELERYRLLDAVAAAHKEVGDVRLRRGDLDAAEEAYRKAYEYGSNAQPGRALLALARGDVDGARASIDAAVADTPVDPSAAIRLSRWRLLPAMVTIALAGGDVERARSAAEELEAVAAEFEGPAFAAAALMGRGSVELAAGQPEQAIAALDEAWRLWRDIDLPYESAQARALLGDARLAAGDAAAARMELSAARSAFERIGAASDARAVAERLGDDAGAGPGDGRRVTRTFMFTDIVTSTDLVGVIGDAAWEDLLRYHDRTLRAEFSTHGGQEVRHTGDGFFVAFESAGDAIEAAVAIQRGLENHRRQHGFAPSVRIGMHTAVATPTAGDYAGKGVHVAARVGDLGAAEEVVVSAATLEAAGPIRFPVSDAREETLKGVAEPVTVYTVDWR